MTYLFETTRDVMRAVDAGRTLSAAGITDKDITTVNIIIDNLENIIGILDPTYGAV